jgi:hypothetical protein
VLQFRREEDGKSPTGNRSAQVQPAVPVPPRMCQLLELFGEQLQQIEAHSRSTRPYRTPARRDDVSYCARPPAAGRAGLEKGRPDRWKRSARQSQTQRLPGRRRIGKNMFSAGRAWEILSHRLRASAKRSFQMLQFLRLTPGLCRLQPWPKTIVLGRDAVVRRRRRLEYFTIAWNTVEVWGQS